MKNALLGFALGFLSCLVAVFVAAYFFVPGIFIPKPEISIQRDTIYKRSYTEAEVAAKWSYYTKNSITTMKVEGPNYLYNAEIAGLTEMPIQYEAWVGYEYASIPMALKDIYIEEIDDQINLTISIPDVPPEIMIIAPGPDREGPWKVWTTPFMNLRNNFFDVWGQGLNTVHNSIYNNLIADPNSEFRDDHRQSFTNVIGILYPEFNDIVVEFYEMEHSPEFGERKTYTYRPNDQEIPTYRLELEKPPEMKN